MPRLQVHVYLPEAQHSAQGLVRTIVKDSTDVYNETMDASWLDSGALCD